MKENILLCVKLLLIALLLAIVVYLSTIVWQVALACVSILIIVLLLFRYFEFPYKVCLFFFRGRNSIGAAMVHPWKKKILWYYKKGFTPTIEIRLHEEQHIKQIEREGSWKFVFKYLFYLLKYGYINNPYEVEARKAEV